MCRGSSLLERLRPMHGQQSSQSLPHAVAYVSGLDRAARSEEPPTPKQEINLKSSSRKHQ